MKRAIGELNLTVVTIVAIAAILGFFMGFRGTMFRSVMSPICCVLNRGSLENGTCNVQNNSAYYECIGQVEGGSTSNGGTPGTSSFQNSHITGSIFSNNTKDFSVAKSINKELSVSSNNDKNKDDKGNKNLDKDAKSNIKDMIKEGLDTKGDYSKSRIASTTSNYSADGKTYTTTSIVTSNTSNHKLRITTTYKKNSSGNYERVSVDWKETSTSLVESGGYEENLNGIKNSYNSVLKNQYNTQRLDDFIKLNGANIYNELNGDIAILDTYSGESIVATANGFFINKGVLVTTWNYVKQSVVNGNKIVISNSSLGNYTFDGIISINTELDLAFIKLKEQIGKTPTLGNVYDLKLESIDFTICNDEDYKLQVKYGYLLKRGGLITSLITLEKSQEGSPLYDKDKNIIGINTSKVLNSSTSIARSTNYIKNLQKKIEKYDFSKIETVSFNDLKTKYTNNETEVSDTSIPKKVWNKYKDVGDIEKTITVPLIKSGYDKKTISLRYVNDIEKYADNFVLADNFIAKLKTQGYKEKHSSTYKRIYEKGNKKVILLSEFNYLIIIIVGE